MFDSATHRRKDPALDVSAERSFQTLAETVHDAAVKKDVRSKETLTAAIGALMHGHAMFAMDDSFTNGVQDSFRHLGPRFNRAVGEHTRSNQLTGTVPAYGVTRVFRNGCRAGRLRDDKGWPPSPTTRRRRESISGSEEAIWSNVGPWSASSQCQPSTDRE